ncbi:MAG: rhamnogalacturonan lyase B N-terminal domain-containing protein, partial [Tepidisphaeraceae bacterium]
MAKPTLRSHSGNSRRPAHGMIEALERRTLFAFGLTTTSTSYIVDTGAGTVFTILRGGTTSSTIHLGDMTSVKYNGVEMLAPYSATSRYSHYEQGQSTGTIVSATVDPNGQWIKITCDDSAAASGGVIQYYVAKKGENNIYMASLPTDVNNGPGEGRYIAYMNRSVFTNIEDPSNISTTDATVEGSDVFYNTTTGITKSKFYNTRRMIDNSVHGITGTNVGAFMNMGNREHSAGGPFFKDIDFQTTSAATEMYNCLFTGHEQTEAYRQGLQGPYAMQFTNGSAPAAPNYSFLEGVGISGLVPASQRGAITGTASGVAVGHQSVVTLTNANAQYWAYADASTGTYTISGVLPGTYTETLYDNELAVGTKTVTISVGKTDRSNIVNTLYQPTPIFRVGTWDGTPKEFLNADKINIMHPSDSRMAPFTNVNYIVGTSTPDSFPLAEFKDVNNDQKITFTLTAAQAAQANTFRIGITSAFAGGRPYIVVNSGQSYAWTSALPASTTQPNSRNITRGTWRGNNFTFTYNIPTSALRAGTNTVDISTNSGSTGGTPWLSPNIVFDALDLVPTSSLTNAPVVKKVIVSPTPRTLAGGASQAFTAVAYDQSNNVTPANFNWAAASGLVDDNGNYVAPSASGSDTVTATSGAVSGAAAVTIDATPPTMQSVVSRKVHGSAGTFDLPINLTATGTAATIEPRIGGGSTLVFTFSEPVHALDGTLSANEFSIQNAAFSSASISGNTLTLN